MKMILLHIHHYFSGTFRLNFRNTENNMTQKKQKKPKMTIKKNQNGKIMKKNTHGMSAIDPSY